MVIIVYLLNILLLTDLAQVCFHLILAAKDIANELNNEPDRPARYEHGNQNGDDS